METFSLAETAHLADQLEISSPQEIIAWAVAQFAPAIAMSSSFQTQSLPLLHMAQQIYPGMRVYFLNTGYHFWDTLLFREYLEREMGLNVVDVYRDHRWANFHERFGRDLPQIDPNLCCFLNKVQPMQQAVVGLRAWITGIRRDQTANRAHARILEMQEDGLMKVNPLLNWTRGDVAAYRAAHNLPEHPLAQKGYRSIGCAPCTQPVSAGKDERAGRWVGKGKTECGLHTDMFRQKDAGIRAFQHQFLLSHIQMDKETEAKEGG